MTKKQWERLQKAPKYAREFVIYDIMKENGENFRKISKKDPLTKPNKQKELFP